MPPNLRLTYSSLPADRDERATVLLEVIRLYDRGLSGFGQKILQLCQTCFSALSRLFGRIDPARPDVFAGPHLARLHQLELLLEARLLLFAPGDETLGGCHAAAPLEMPRARQCLWSEESARRAC